MFPLRKSQSIAVLLFSMTGAINVSFVEGTIHRSFMQTIKILIRLHSCAFTDCTCYKNRLFYNIAGTSIFSFVQVFVSRTCASLICVFAVCLTWMQIWGVPLGQEDKGADWFLTSIGLSIAWTMQGRPIFSACREKLSELYINICCCRNHSAVFSDMTNKNYMFTTTSL